jgi:hypothetical protein
MSTPSPTTAHSTEPADSGAAIAVVRVWLEEVSTDVFEFTTDRAAATHTLEMVGDTMLPETLAAATGTVRMATSDSSNIRLY